MTDKVHGMPRDEWDNYGVVVPKPRAYAKRNELLAIEALASALSFVENRAFAGFNPLRPGPQALADAARILATLSGQGWKLESK